MVSRRLVDDTSTDQTAIREEGRRLIADTRRKVIKAYARFEAEKAKADPSGAAAADPSGAAAADPMSAPEPTEEQLTRKLDIESQIFHLSHRIIAYRDSVEEAAKKLDAARDAKDEAGAADAQCTLKAAQVVRANGNKKMLDLKVQLESLKREISRVY